MENEEIRSLVIFSEAAKEVMWVTNEIHDALDTLSNAYIAGECTNLIGESIRVIRSKISCINAINMEKLFGVPRSVMLDSAEVEKQNLKSKEK